MSVAQRIWRRLASPDGQAAVETIGVLPVVLLVGALLWQLALTGQTAWLCAVAARVAARAEAVGQDAEGAARSALPAALERGFRLEREGDGRVRVRVRVPLLVDGWRSPIDWEASARLAPGAPR